MNADVRILRNPRLALAPSDEGYLAYNIENSQLHRLNAAASLIIEISNGKHTAAEVCRQVSPLLENPDASEMMQWVRTAISEGLLKALEPGDAISSATPPEEFVSAAKELRSDGMVLAAFVCQHYATFMLPADPAQWQALGELAHIVGRREDARVAYEKYVQFNPDDAEAAQILVSLRNEPPPPRAPNRCIEQLYARFADFYEDNMCGDLEYQAPERLADSLNAELGTAENLQVLELGCGTGLAAPILRKRAKYLYGIDLSPQMAARAEATGLYNGIEVAEITEWLSRPNAGPAGPAGPFDLIAACDTLIYFGDLQQVIAPAARLLQPRGCMVFTVERGETGPFQLTDSGRYTHSETHIRDVARLAGLRVASLTEGFLRYEYGKPVVGLVTVLRKDQA
jgi:predicted TPR repeat methyltransferase